MLSDNSYKTEEEKQEEEEAAVKKKLPVPLQQKDQAVKPGKSECDSDGKSFEFIWKECQMYFCVTLDTFSVSTFFREKPTQDFVKCHLLVLCA